MKITKFFKFVRLEITPGELERMFMLPEYMSGPLIRFYFAITKTIPIKNNKVKGKK